MTDSMSLPKKQVSFFQRAMKIEVSENMVTPNILLKRQKQIQLAKFSTGEFIGQCLSLNTHLPKLRDPC